MPDIRTILPPGATAALAAGYSDATFCQANQAAVNGMYPPAQVLTDPVLAGFYFPATNVPPPLLTPALREVAILSTLAASGGSTTNIAIHLYIGLAVGLTVDELAGVLGAVGSYAGAGRLMDGLATFETTLTVLAAQVKAKDTGVMAIVGALRAAFTPGATPSTPTTSTTASGPKEKPAKTGKAGKVEKVDKVAKVAKDKSARADKPAKARKSGGAVASPEPTPKPGKSDKKGKGGKAARAGRTPA